MTNIKNFIKKLDKYKREEKKKLKENLWNASFYYEGKVKETTPIKEWFLETSIFTDTSWLKWSRSKFRTSVWTNLNYAPVIEIWIEWKKFNYHKWERIFKTSQWAWMFRETLDKEENNILKIIKKWKNSI